jgi:hypothetical protein
MGLQQRNIHVIFQRIAVTQMRLAQCIAVMLHAGIAVMMTAYSNTRVLIKFWVLEFMAAKLGLVS